MAEQQLSRPDAEELPADFLFLVFEDLVLPDAVAVSRACKFWRSVCDESWERRARGRWEHHSGRWSALVQSGAWKKYYEARHQVGRHGARK
jgi:hypothetical protein